MSHLIVFKGNHSITVTPPEGTCYLYRIGSGSINGKDFIEINNAARLNELAEMLRDDYTNWIYSLNELFISARLCTKELSLFFLSDISAKRSEFFETYECVCGLLLIKESLEKYEIASAQLIGFDTGFIRAFKALFTDIRVDVESYAESKTSVKRRVLADVLYLSRITAVVIVNAFTRSSRVCMQSTYGRLFFSIFPQMFSDSGRETKYGDYFNENDQFVVSIMTDGMHQKLSVNNYYRYKKLASEKRFLIVDEYLRVSDVTLGLFWAIRLWWFYYRQQTQIYKFNDIDITGLIRVELLFSVSRLTRLCVMMGSLRRCFQKVNVKEVVYYPCEYPLGRLISYVLSVVSTDILRTGFQMSICSRRRLEQYLAPGEGSLKLPFIYRAPIPDQIISEDSSAAQIYRYSGYVNVSTMEKVYRYAYLDDLHPEKQRNCELIAPGLHDGADLLDRLQGMIKQYPNTQYMFKPHPRADNRYIDRYIDNRNIQISHRSMPELLSIVSVVYVTHSSVGIEAQRLGLKVVVIDVPGRINPSPLLDAHHSDIVRWSDDRFL